MKEKIRAVYRVCAYTCAFLFWISVFLHLTAFFPTRLQGVMQYVSVATALGIVTFFYRPS